MSLFPKDIYTALKTELSGATLLPYVDVVEILKYRRDLLPDFTNYAIVISPVSARSVPYKAAQRWIECMIELVLLGKIRTGQENAIMVDDPGGSPPDVGLLAMYEDVYRSLYKNTLGGVIELYPGLEELDVLTRFDVLAPGEGADDFIYEARVGYQVRGERWVDLA